MKRCELWRPMGGGEWKKYYGVLDKHGEPKAVQEYKRCHRQDLQRSSEAERGKKKK